MYWRVLRLRRIRPNGWQRALLVEGVTTVGLVLALADVASAWVVLVLPLGTMLVAKAHDVIATLLPADPAREVRELPPPRLADYLPFAVVIGVYLLVLVLADGDTLRVALLCFYLAFIASALLTRNFSKR
jgi:hypothetical protein